MHIFPHDPYLDAMLGASEERIELYLNTANEHRSWQQRSAPRAAGTAGWAGWQGGGMERA